MEAPDNRLANCRSVNSRTLATRRQLLVSLAFLAALFLLIDPRQAVSESVSTTPLKETLDSKKQGFLSAAPASVVAAYDRGIRQVTLDGVLESALNVGATAPNFSLMNASAEKVELSKILDSHDGAVLVWYRGGWCPYCNLTLFHYRENLLPELRKRNIALLAISPELPDNSLSTKQKNKLGFTVLSDLGNRVAKSYGIVFALTPEVAALYQEKFDLSEHNGTDSKELPLAATYYVQKDRSIKYAFIDADYRNRAEPVDILAAIDLADPGLANPKN